jgi:hypothetical protein
LDGTDIIKETSRDGKDRPAGDCQLKAQLPGVKLSDNVPPDVAITDAQAQELLAALRAGDTEKAVQAARTWLVEVLKRVSAKVQQLQDARDKEVAASAGDDTHGNALIALRRLSDASTPLLQAQESVERAIAAADQALQQPPRRSQRRQRGAQQAREESVTHLLHAIELARDAVREAAGRLLVVCLHDLCHQSSTIIAVLQCDKLKAVDTLLSTTILLSKFSSRHMRQHSAGPPGAPVVPTLYISATVRDGGNAALLQGSSHPTHLMQVAQSARIRAKQLADEAKGKGTEELAALVLAALPPRQPRLFGVSPPDDLLPPELLEWLPTLDTGPSLKLDSLHAPDSPAVQQLLPQARAALAQLPHWQGVSADEIQVQRAEQVGLACNSSAKGSKGALQEMLAQALHSMPWWQLRQLDWTSATARSSHRYILSHGGLMCTSSAQGQVPLAVAEAAATGQGPQA